MGDTVYAIVVAILASVCLVILSGLVMYWLWNGLISNLFSLRQITFLEGIGLIVFVNLFKNSVSTQVKK